MVPKLNASGDGTLHHCTCAGLHISQHCVSPDGCSRTYVTDTFWAMTSVAL